MRRSEHFEERSDEKCESVDAVVLQRSWTACPRRYGWWPAPYSVWYSRADVCKPRMPTLDAIDLTLDPSPIDGKIKEALTKEFPNGPEGASIRIELPGKQKGHQPEAW